MATKTLPFIYFNLGGEMFYVIQQRLVDQKIPQDKANKIINDIVGAMFRENMLEEVFKPQDVYSREAISSLFERLVHSSIMRLNHESINKLFDLMYMVFKFQVVNCIYPEDLLLVTLNHLDSIKMCPALTSELKKKVEATTMIFIQKYRVLIHLEFERIYELITAFLKDCNTKVSILMKYGLQLANGELVTAHPKRKETAIMAHIDKEATVEILGESVKKKWLDLLPETWCDIDGNRYLDIGKNIRENGNWATYPMSLISKKRNNQQIQETC